MPCKWQTSRRAYLSRPNSQRRLANIRVCQAPVPLTPVNVQTYRALEIPAPVDNNGHAWAIEPGMHWNANAEQVSPIRKESLLWGVGALLVQSTQHVFLLECQELKTHSIEWVYACKWLPQHMFGTSVDLARACQFCRYRCAELQQGS